MIQAYLGEIRMFAGDYAPRNFLLCDGRDISIGDYQALYSLIGNTYGGNGRTTFAVPDLRGRLVVGRGHAPGRSDYRLGEKGGHETIELTDVQTSHSHQVMAASVDGTEGGPADNVITKERQNFAAPGGPAAMALMSPLAVGQAGSKAPHENRQPYVVVNFIIACRGAYPSAY